MNSEFESYDELYFRGLLLSGKLRESVAYLKRFPEKKPLYERYTERFEMGRLTYPTDNETIKKILKPYYLYYKDIFWDESSVSRAELRLILNLRSEFPNMSGDDLAVIEETLGETVKRLGYNFLGGETSGFKGPYIWKTTRDKYYEVELPYGTKMITVHFMDNFLSTSWIDYLSFGEFGTGGWTNRHDGDLWCVEKRWENHLDTASFKISFLQHETQHVDDFQKYPGLSAVDLEYRAKLIELIYSDDRNLFFGILRQSDSRDKNNSHTYASYLLGKDITRKVLGLDMVFSLKQFDGKFPEIRQAARACYDEHTERLNEFYKTKPYIDEDEENLTFL